MPVNLDQPVNDLHVTITTGDDDVRVQSNVYGIAMIQQGQQVNAFSQSLNHGANWPNGSTNEGDVGFSQARIRDIRAFRIMFSSGQPDPFATQDNWNMNSIKVTCRLDGGNDLDLLLDQAGTPLHRFTGGSPEWEVYFNWSYLR